jgi:leader peptidase (prepilin peptidase)/N-methyltransferase
MLAATIIDARTRRIPDALNAVAFAAGLMATFVLQRSMAAALVGAGVGYATIFLANWAFRTLRGRDGIGLGDAKLLGALGAWVAWTGLPFVVLIAASGGLLFAAVRRIRPQEAIVFGPFLGIGGMIVWIAEIYGSDLV